MELPADGHVHSQWSWDARLVGDMDATCARAVALGLPAVVFTEHVDLTPFRPAADVMRDYLAEIPRMVAGSGVFTALAHIDYPVRSWPADAGPFRPEDFEPEFRQALAALADGERALEINTRLPLHPLILRRWVEEGGRTVTFGSDAHRPDAVGDGLGGAGRLARDMGFAPGGRPAGEWTLVR
ncbi:PHP domain-containing protein [Kineosporia sp. J2-2]|uniref:PHP domain-containing protein n=1 Tax=Kineosporia corallincola TaxID=2835133 RepID=A0ABS5TDG1_9ACTN|nr:PHP domain-containing protein [Kineosporia corallincola]MBT0769090.1 PHP domain-containing protein [Kineosporia corallincola]